MWFSGACGSLVSRNTVLSFGCVVLGVWWLFESACLCRVHVAGHRVISGVQTQPTTGRQRQTDRQRDRHTACPDRACGFIKELCVPHSSTRWEMARSGTRGTGIRYAAQVLHQIPVEAVTEAHGPGMGTPGGYSERAESSSFSRFVSFVRWVFTPHLSLCTCCKKQRSFVHSISSVILYLIQSIAAHTHSRALPFHYDLHHHRRLAGSAVPGSITGRSAG